MARYSDAHVDITPTQQDSIYIYGLFFVRILACKPDKTKDKGQDKMRNDTHKNLRGSPNQATSTGKYRRILLSNVRITTSLK